MSSDRSRRSARASTCRSRWTRGAASVLDEACKVGAVVGNDISGFGDPDYLAIAARRGASVVATHIRLRPRVADPEPHYDDLVGDVTTLLLDRAARACAAGLAVDQIALDAGLDLGKTPVQSAVLLRETEALASHGYTLLLSASNKRFLGELLGLDIDGRRAVSLASVAYGVAHGCRIVRVHDVAGTVQVCRMVERILGQDLGRRDEHRPREGQRPRAARACRRRARDRAPRRGRRGFRGRGLHDAGPRHCVGRGRSRGPDHRHARRRAGRGRQRSVEPAIHDAAAGRRRA